MKDGMCVEYFRFDFDSKPIVWEKYLHMKK